jgi:long-chain fatty acid transport protein
MAMAFAVASADGADASTIFYNPAGMTSLRDGLSVTLGATYLLPGATFAGPTNQNRFDKTTMETWAFVLPHAYVAYKVPQSDLAVGVGLFVPFGAGTRWNDTWTGRNLGVRTYIQTITINPNVAYALLDKKLSLAAGLTYSLGHAELRQRVPNFNPEPVLNLVGSGTAISWNAAVTFAPDKNWKFGLSYRHNINMKYDGNAKFTSDAEGNTPLSGGLNNLFTDGPGGTALNLPFDARFGVSYRVTEDWMVELGIDYVGWSSYDTLRIRFDKAPGNPSASGTVINPRNYTNAPVFRLGTEAKVSDILKLRGGVYYDVVPVDAKFTQPILPDANRLGVSAGAGIKLGDRFMIDVAYLFVYGFQREVKGSVFGFDGIYNAWANAASLSVSYTF